MTTSSLLFLITQLCVGGCVVEVEYTDKVVEVEYTDKVVEVEYTDKVVSAHKGDSFGSALATSYRKLVIGAPVDKEGSGSIIPEENIRIYAPQPQTYFGTSVDVNQHFIVASALEPHSVYVYDSNSPYTLKARLPVDFVSDVVISDDNTIAVSHYDENMVTIFVYEGEGEWSLGQKLLLEGCTQSLAISVHTLLVVEMHGHAFPINGIVHVYNNNGKKWVKSQTIEQHGVCYFGGSIAMDGSHLAVTAQQWHGGEHFTAVLYTYQLDVSTNTWVNNGYLNLPTVSSCVSIQKDTLVATLTDYNIHETECGYVYKLSKSIKNNASVALYQWNHAAVFTTKADPLTKEDDQHHRAVRVEGQLVFTGRYDRYGFGKVFVHDLSHIH